MSYLVDTNIFLWWLSDDQRLSKRVRELLSSASLEFHLSACSIWEISIKSSLGKLNKIKNLSKIAKEEGFSLIGISPEHCERVGSLPMIHKDPFDRLLIAQSIDLKLKFLTGDALLKEYGSFVVVN